MLITFIPNNRMIHADEGISLQKAAQEAGIDTGGLCNGGKTCGK